MTYVSFVKKTKKALRCPKKAPPNAESNNHLDVYGAFLSRVNKFRDFGAVPIRLVFDQQMSKEILGDNEAKWHKSCYGKFDQAKVDAKKHHPQSSQHEEQAQESCSKRHKIAMERCFFVKVMI